MAIHVKDEHFHGAIQKQDGQDNFIFKCGTGEIWNFNLKELLSLMQMWPALRAELEKNHFKHMPDPGKEGEFIEIPGAGKIFYQH